MPAPPSSSGNTGLATPDKPISPKTADDINDMFKELDVEQAPAPEKKEPKEKEKEEPEEVEDLELVEAEEEVEKIDLAKEDDFEIETPPRKKEILKRYPELFKEFPFLERVMYRDRQWNELLGSFDDAKELVDRAEVFSSFETQLLSGDTSEVLKNVKETDEKAFNIIVDEYLPTLWKVDKDAYRHVTGNLNKRLIMEMVQEANESNNEDLKQAALIVNRFIFGTDRYTAPSRLVDSDKPDDKKNELEQERLSLVQERFEAARDDLQSQVDNTLRATISDYIDPKGNMSSYVKKNAVADAMRLLSQAVADDPSVSKNLDSLWRASFAARFSKDTLGKIKSFYLSKAKANLKSAILKARSEALKDAPRHNSKETDDESDQEESPRILRKQIAPGRPRQEKGKNDGPRKGESVTDFFMRD
jgi:hypothetical protein